MRSTSSGPLRWGVLSTARINDKLLAGAAQSASAEVVAVASRDAHRAAAFAGRFGIPRAYGRYEELLADDDVQAVYIPLPNGMHHQWTMAALQADKHVLCEKPYSRRPDDVDEAFTTAESRGLVLSEGFMYRYHPQTATLARMVLHDRAIGDVRLISASFTWPTGMAGDIRLDPALDGGSLLDVGVYCVSAARLLAGEPIAVTAQQVTGTSGVDVCFAATMKFATGALAHFDCGFHLPDRSRLEVLGTTGTLRVADPWHCVDGELTVIPKDGPARTVPVPRASSYQLELEEFAKAVQGEAHTLLGRADALGQARTVDALLRSATSGHAVMVR